MGSLCGELIFAFGSQAYERTPLGGARDRRLLYGYFAATSSLIFSMRALDPSFRVSAVAARDR
eukprot:3850576-Rhodomonas_salina.1